MTGNAPSFDTIFRGAIDVASDEERAAFITRACGSDEELRRRVERLVYAHFQAGSFLESPPASPTAAMDPAASTDGPGTVIGNYKLLQSIGEGGMGTVYMAEQTTPMRRTVALKLIKAGMDSRQILARFEAERQALALMDHPNIAKVFDAGTADTGRPYFVMELVKGIPITRFCDERRLTTRERLALVIPVCQALQHAHQKGVIHRDLKPSNVLVALYDDKPVPKVIDFGVAKATGLRLTEQTLYTEFGAIVGTLEYMSPEQAQLNQLDIDTRSDIYSLGGLWDADTGEAKATLKGHASPVCSLAFSPDGTTLASASDDSTVKLWSVQASAPKDLLEGHIGGARSVTFSPDGTMAATEGFDRKVRLWEVSSGMLKATLEGHRCLVECLAFTPDGRTLASAGTDWGPRLWDAASGKLKTTLKGHTARIRAARFSADGKTLATAGMDDTVRLWDAATGKPCATVRVAMSQGNCVAFAPDVKALATGGEDGTILLWDLGVGSSKVLLQGKGHSVVSLVFSPDRRTLASGGRDCKIVLWDLTTGRSRPPFEGHSNWVSSLAFSPDGRCLASAGYDRTVMLWDVATAETTLTLKLGTNQRTGVTFSPDGTILATISSDDAVRLWRAASKADMRAEVK